MLQKEALEKPLERIVMKKDWKKKLKRMGAVLLLAVLLVQTIGSHAYAAETRDAVTENPASMEVQKPAGETDADGNTGSTEETKNSEETSEPDVKEDSGQEDVLEGGAIEEEMQEPEEQEEPEDSEDVQELSSDYKVKLSWREKGGEAKLLTETAEPGEQVQIQVSAYEWWEMAGISVLSGEASVEIQENQETEGIYEFVMPEGEVSVDIDFQDTLFHWEEDDLDGAYEWVDRYLPEGFEDILQYGDSWWDALYDHEREIAEMCRDSIPEAKPDPNRYTDQSIEECLAVLESGVSPEEFFSGTLFEGLEAEELQALNGDGWTLEDVEELFTAWLWEDRESEIYAAYLENEPEHYESLLYAVGVAMTNAGVSVTYDSTEGGEEVAVLRLVPTGFTGIGHGPIHNLVLGGMQGACLDFGSPATTGALYYAAEGTYEKCSGPIGYLVMLLGSYSLSREDYACLQVAVWALCESTSFKEVNVKIFAASRMGGTENMSKPKRDALFEKVWVYYKTALQNTRPYYVFHAKNSNYQRTAVPKVPDTTSTPGDPSLPPEGVDPEFANYEDTITVTYAVNITKSDWQTKVGLKGCTIDIYENGSKVSTVTTDSAGNASWSTSKSASASADYCVNYGELSPEQQAGITGCKSLDEAVAQVNAELSAFAATQYTYRIREVTAPTGYVWAANEKEQSIAGNETANFSITNERTLGSVELVKYDTESESAAVQGDATLEGAVYGIYAKKDILHQDKKTGVVNRDGVLWKKDQLIQTQTIGRSPKCDGSGYMLNTDGSRHIANPGGTIAYEDTPGRTRFGDLELGEYYIREITPSEGYMLDEASYDVTFTYKDQMVKVEVRDETAGEADNELTADDGSTSKTIYSGDYVIKQGIQFVKTSDNAWQTELSPIEGAGFSVYLISGLSGVRDGSITPLNGTWGADDIMAFYDYDFSGEERATLYKRTAHEEWTEGDRKWLTPLGGNKYQVVEMFTDKDGRIETPELPYGTYVVVETTTPEHHVMAKPFIVYITQDGGVLYTDATKQTTEKSYTPEEGIRYGDHKNTKDREGRILQKQRIINNTITETYLRVVKADEEFLVQPGAYISPEEVVRGTVLKEGAQYRLRCRTLELSEESLKALNWNYDGQGYLSYYAPNTKELTGTAEHPFTTSFLRSGGKILDCYITLPQELPIGTYELEELTAPEGYVVNGSEQAVVDTSTGRVNGYEIVDAPKEKTIFTINNGSVYPDGQMGTNKYALKDAYGNLTVTVLQKNQEQKGIIEVYKHGEQVSGAEKGSVTLLEKLKGEPFRYLKLENVSGEADLIFSYEDAPVEGARFQVIAAEDIYTQELNKALFDQYQVNAEDYRIYRKGDVVAEITTDRKGWGYAAGLYIGKYKLVETVAGPGFVLNTKETLFEITPKEQTVSFDFHSADYENQRQKLEITVAKKDAESGEALAGAVYGLYAAEDIYTNIEYSQEAGKWVVRDMPEILIAKDTLAATCITDKTGKASFEPDLPLGKYYVRELEAPLGYLTAPEDIFLDGSYEGEKGGQDAEIQRHRAEFGNIKTTARISKQDLTNRKELPGASLELYEIGVNEKGELLKKGDSYVMAKKDAWISGNTPYEIRGLKLGRTYLLRERKPAEGYVTAEDLLFRLVQERDEEGNLLEAAGMYVLAGEEWKRCQEDLLVMLDDVTKIQISKKDITTKGELPGALLELYNEKGELLEDWISEEEPHYIEMLPIGKYRLVEREAPYGYGYAEDVVFEVKDTGEIQKAEMLDDVQKVQVEKSTISLTQAGDVYKNTVDCVRNKTDVKLDHFTLTDKLPEQVWLTELWTGTYNQELIYRVEYRINGGGDWILWEEGLDTGTNHHLEVPGELLTKEKHITSFRILFGTVEGQFENEICPAYLVKVDPSAQGGMLNRIELEAEQDGIPHRDRAETMTRMFFRMMRGYAPKGEAEPAYEVVNTVTPEEAEHIEEKAERIKKDREVDGETWPEMTVKEDLASPPTGDAARPLVWLSLLAASAAGISGYFLWRRKKEQKCG